AVLAAPASAWADPVGQALLADHLAIADRLELQVDGLAAAPAGTEYRVWLLSDDGDSAQAIGALLPQSDTSALLVYDQPAGESLFLQYSQVRVTTELVGSTAAAPGGFEVLA